MSGTERENTKNDRAQSAPLQPEKSVEKVRAAVFRDRLVSSCLLLRKMLPKVFISPICENLRTGRTQPGKTIINETHFRLWRKNSEMKGVDMIADHRASLAYRKNCSPPFCSGNVFLFLLLMLRNPSLVHGSDPESRTQRNKTRFCLR